VGILPPELADLFFSSPPYPLLRAERTDVFIVSFPFSEFLVFQLGSMAGW